jgi:hypothetical protein
LLPEDKVSIIEEIVRKHSKEGERKKKQAVIIVGDGINDAPALTNYSFYEGAIFLDLKFKTIKTIPAIINKDQYCNQTDI